MQRAGHSYATAHDLLLLHLTKNMVNETASGASLN